MIDASAFRIDINGIWYHDGSPMMRQSLVRLFAIRALKREPDGTYWLKTPYEAYQIEVEDVPFLITSIELDGDDMDLITNIDERVPLGPNKTMMLRTPSFGGQPLPYIDVRAGLQARLSRNVYYDIISRATLQGQCLVINSRGAEHCVGRLEEC